eukprot:Skav214707  [mRNA]  locus=scaffold331:217989:220820:- [translate_table: standard]
MADSKTAIDFGQYLLSHGMRQHLIGQGILVTVVEVRGDLVRVKHVDNKVFSIHIDVALPNPAMVELKLRWRKALLAAQLVSAPIRMLGLQRISDDVFRATEDTVMLRQCGLVNTKELRVIESYAGGFGGWSRAIGFLNQTNPEAPIHTVGGIEIDPNVAESWNVNAGQRHGCTCFVGDATDIHVWTDACENTQPSMLTISSPCKSFSRAGGQDGWNSHEAYCMAASMWFAHLSGIQVLGIENVEALKKKKEHWTGFEALVDFCQLTIAAEACVNSHAFHPVSRNREIAVLVAKNLGLPAEIPVDIPGAFVEDRMVGLWNTKKWIDPPTEHIADLTLDEITMQEYTRHDRLPSFMKHDMMVGSKMEARHVRCIRSQKPIPSGTMLAQYSNQHNLQGQVLGSLRRINRTDCRFLHPLELAVASGVTSPVILPRDRPTAYMIVGNMITEMHGLFGITMTLNIMKDILKCEELDIPKILEFHEKMTINRSNIQWIIGDTTEGIMYARGTMLDQGIPKMSCTPLDDDPISQFAADFQDGRIIKVREMVGSSIEIPFSTKVAFDVKPDHVMDAMRKMHPTWEPDETFGDQGQVIAKGRGFNDDILTIEGHDTARMFDLDGVILCWAQFICKVPIKPHERLLGWDINGMPVSNVAWFDADGTPYDPSSPIMFNGKLSTDGNIPWPSHEHDNHVLVVRIQDMSIGSQLVKFTPGECIEDLLAAEQILLGPFDKIVDVRDHTSSLVNPSTFLHESKAVVFKIIPAHHLIRVEILHQYTKKERWITKGTRLFDVHHRLPNQKPVDKDGRELPWDFPVFHGMVVTVIDDDDEEQISPTIPFSIEEEPFHDELMKQQQDTDIHQLVIQATEKVQEAMQVTMNSIFTFDDIAATRARIALLMNYGPAVGDDEMTFHLQQLSARAPVQVLGIKRWDSNFLTWDNLSLPEPQVTRAIK